jgi:hypothetical protein
LLAVDGPIGSRLACAAMTAGRLLAVAGLLATLRLCHIRMIDRTSSLLLPVRASL